MAACASTNVAVRFVASTASQSSRFIRITQLIAGDAGVADDDVEPAVPSDDLARQLLDRRLVRHIQAHRFGRVAGRRELPRRFVRMIAARGGDHNRALLAEAPGNRAPDAARRTGDERHFP